MLDSDNPVRANWKLLHDADLDVDEPGRIVATLAKVFAASVVLVTVGGLGIWSGYELALGSELWGSIVGGAVLIVYMLALARGSRGRVGRAYRLVVDFRVHAANAAKS